MKNTTTCEFGQPLQIGQNGTLIPATNKDIGFSFGTSTCYTQTQEEIFTISTTSGYSFIIKKSLNLGDIFVITFLIFFTIFIVSKFFISMFYRKEIKQKFYDDF